MKNIFVLVCSLLFGLTSAQTHRFIYDFTYKADSTQKDGRTVKMVLDVDGEKTQFYEFKALKMDSLNRTTSDFYTYEFPYEKLVRTTGSSTNRNYQLKGGQYYTWDSTDPITWKITNDTKDRDGFRVQKAVAQFGGRQWTAWFTTDLPFSEGPYKFTGLPGLVTDVSDAESNFVYALSAVKKLKVTNPDIVETVFRKNALKIPFKKYQEILVTHYNDPYNKYRSMQAGSWGITQNGKTINTVEGLNEITRNEQERIRKNNNPIEKDKMITYPVR